MRRPVVLLPIICGLIFAAGILLGTLIGKSPAENEQAQYDKIGAVMNFVVKNYVDSVNLKTLTDNTIEAMLQHLDPHSYYFTAQEEQDMNEPLQGNFEGVGIEYNVIRDTVVVLNIVPGGPASKTNLQPGDRIVKANDTLLTGKNSNDKFVKGKLKGPGGTKVTVTVKRPSKAAMFTVEITRGSVPIYSIDAAYMLDKETGYIRLLRFAQTSYDEFVHASDSLLKLGMKKLVLDLRGNGGGFLDAATSIADEFLPDGKLIVYTKGRADGNDTTRASNRGKLTTMPLAILVDENSASASEILAGAIQDNDRGIIVGRRTFGKGLVQVEQKLSDGSAFRLTIARYYTPTGRCIQKPYNKGLDEYEADEANRYKHGELLNADSIKFPDSLKYKTPGGKTVYGGGGIMPDKFVPLDTAGGTDYLDKLFYNNIFLLWSLNYSQQNSKSIAAMGLDAFHRNFVVTDAMVSDFVSTAARNGVKQNDEQMKRSLPLIKRYMKADLARNIFGDAAYYVMWNDDDTCVHAAMDALEK